MTLEELAALIKKQNEQITALTAQVTTLSGTVTGLTEGDASIDKRLEKAKADVLASITPKPGDTDKGGEKGKGKEGETDLSAAIEAAVTKVIAPIAAKVTKIEEGNTAAEKAAAKKALIAGVIAKKFPGAKSPAHRVQIEELEEYLDLSNPADEKAAEAVVEKWSKRKGKDVLDQLAKPFTANPAAEGANDAAPNADKVKEQIEKIDKAPVGARL